MKVEMLSLALSATLMVGAAHAQKPLEPPEGVTELVVRLRPSPPGPQPESVVNAVNEGRPVPHGLGEGSPNRGRLAIPDRAAGRAAEWIPDHSDSPLARLQRYVVFGYPENANLMAIRAALANNPMVESVGYNLPVQLHAGGTSHRASEAVPTKRTEPTDGLFGAPCGEQTAAQWGIHMMRLPEAWDWAKGHGTIGLVDTGVQVDHPDLRAFHGSLGALVYDGGGLREHLSRDVDDFNCSIDERDPLDDPPPGDRAGHGTHVSGIAAATTNNQVIGEPASAAGACWQCSLLMARTNVGGVQMFLNSRASGLEYFTRLNPAQIVSMSFGIDGSLLAEFLDPFDCSDGYPEIARFCEILTLAEQRDVLMVASSGNWKWIHVDFPARDPRVVAVGGVEQVALAPGCTFARWIRPGCESVGFGDQCGSNAGPEQELVAPAETVLSTMYTGYDHNPGLVCGDLRDGVTDGFGPCTGTSMSAPFVAGLAAVLRSINPLAGKDDVRDMMSSTASQAASHDPTLGYGLPDAEAAVKRALGVVDGKTMTNRLTPLFSFYSPLEQTHAYTTVPTLGTAWVFEDAEPFDSEAFTPRVPGYDFFPGFGGPGEPSCTQTDCQPRAAFFVFTTAAPPYSGAPPLVPLYRLRYDSGITPGCPSPPAALASTSRDFTLATTVSEVLFLRQDVVDLGGIGYHLDGIDGYLYQACPGDTCQPPGTKRILRRYHATRRDFAIFAEPDAGQFPGYVAYPDPALPEVIGYAYLNVDSDGDTLIDGWERLLGTGVLDPDSDDDGVLDGTEVHVYLRADLNPVLHDYRDVCSNGCPIFTDGFESGTTSQWSLTVP